MQTNTHIEVVSLYHCYACSRHTGRNVYRNYENTLNVVGWPLAAYF